MAKTRQPSSKLVRGLPGVILTLATTAAFFALEAWTSPGRIAIVLSVATLLLVVWWGWGIGWRLRNPLHRLPPPKTRTPAEEAKRERTRAIRGDLSVVFHAYTKPAVVALKELTAQVVGPLSDHSASAALVSGLLQGYVISELDSAERKLVSAFETHFPDSDRVRDRILELDLDKKSPDDYGLDVYLHYGHYSHLLTWIDSASLVLGRTLTEFPGFKEWSSLDARLVEKLREVLAAPELAHYRDGFEEYFRQRS